MTRYSQLFMLLLTGSLLAQTSVPEIPYDSAPNLLKLPEHIHMGEAVGVATNSVAHSVQHLCFLFRRQSISCRELLVLQLSECLLESFPKAFPDVNTGWERALNGSLTIR